MRYLEFLDLLHKEKKPKRYFEIGVRWGESIALAQFEAVGVDPEFRIDRQIVAKTRLYRLESDRFFETVDARKLFDGKGADMSFIDGMHLAEFAYRDFINTAAICDKGAIVVFDDVLPERIEFAGRAPKWKAWTGDVYRTLCAIKESFPSLEIAVVNIEGQGLGLIRNIKLTKSELNAVSVQKVSKLLEETEIYTVNSVQEISEQYESLGINLISEDQALKWVLG
jgi:predicted O-methyltransferase YrrM